ncbi:putative Ig domain-containing protein [Dechloromonas denitrificans]|uniref:putative Ig domain-containing protein n=1 Tax=Dechloromonas denitrificans TaxID=281362 RepID=UPI001CF80544|nr:putative Ig domain-containing protein [Dechloromonas denitrificans]UCV03339.1 hypothetical protein KI611_20110 [Dechloromonas denitrificans]
MDKKRIALAGLAMLAAAECAHAATQLQIDTARTKAAVWLITQQKGDGNWSSGQGADISVTAQTAAGLLAAGVKGFPVNNAGVWLGNADAQSVDALARQIRAKVVPFANLNAQHDKLLTWKTYPARSIWGTYPQYGTSFSDTGLAILATVPFSYGTQLSELGNAVYCNILPVQSAAGGWPHIPATVAATTPSSASGGAVLPTTMTLLALNAVRAKFGWDTNACGSSSYTITTAVQNAANWLLSQKNGDGGVGEKGVSTIFSTALAYQGIRAARPSDAALPGLIDYVISRQDANGSWGNEPMQTGLVLEQLATLATQPLDTDGDGIPDEVEVILGSNPTIADARSLADKGNGNTQPGTTTPLALSVSATVNQAFNYTLTSTIGISPFTWNLIGGALPPGLALSSSGLISGVPSQLGSYTFQYASTDSGAPQITRPTLGLITVIRRTPGTGDLNGDGKVDLADVILAQQIALGKMAPTVAQLAAGDVAPDTDPDGVIDASDVAWIARKLLKLR